MRIAYRVREREKGEKHEKYKKKKKSDSKSFWAFGIEHFSNKKVLSKCALKFRSVWVWIQALGSFCDNPQEKMYETHWLDYWY